MIQNIYYIIDMTDPDLNDILTFCVGNINTLRKSVNENQCVVKLPIGDPEPTVLNGYTTYDHSAILTELAGTNWTADII